MKKLVFQQKRSGPVSYTHLDVYKRQALLNGSLVDYLVPMASGLPDIEIAHVETPTTTSEIGAKGAGEAGLAGAVGAVLNAVNDALAPFDVMLTEVPLTPPRILAALGKI